MPPERGPFHVRRLLHSYADRLTLPSRARITAVGGAGDIYNAGFQGNGASIVATYSVTPGQSVQVKRTSGGSGTTGSTSQFRNGQYGGDAIAFTVGGTTKVVAGGGGGQAGDSDFGLAVGSLMGKGGAAGVPSGPGIAPGSGGYGGSGTAHVLAWVSAPVSDDGSCRMRAA